MTVREWIAAARRFLGAASIDAADLEAQLLAAHVLLVDRPWLLAHPDEPFPELAGESVLARRLAHEPLAYILGQREFYGRRFAVGPGVLIPRHETELLVECALDWFREGTDRRTVLDLGTGSGCIAVTLKLELPRLEVFASDVSPRALELASRNASDLSAEVCLLESDCFENLLGRQFDAIVTNPPYIGEREQLPAEVTQFEPHAALFAGPTGMEFYERLAGEASAHLVAGGSLFMEVGYRQANAVAELFRDTGWNVLGVVKDIAGIDRVVICAPGFIA